MDFLSYVADSVSNVVRDTLRGLLFVIFFDFMAEKQWVMCREISHQAPRKVRLTSHNLGELNKASSRMKINRKLGKYFGVKVYYYLEILFYLNLSICFPVYLIINSPLHFMGSIMAVII